MTRQSQTRQDQEEAHMPRDAGLWVVRVSVNDFAPCGVWRYAAPLPLFLLQP
jgi:hypothetical protein